MREKAPHTISRDIEMGVHETDLVYKQPRKFSSIPVKTPQPDYMSWSTASLFVCFFWGIFAFIASNKVKKYNNLKAYNEAAYYSRAALRHNQSAVACFVVTMFIIGLPLSIALAVQGDINKFPSAREFFG